MNYDEKYHPDVESEEDQDHPDVENEENQDRDPSAGASILKSFLKLIVAPFTWITLPVYYFSQKPWEKQALKNKVWAVPIEVSNEEITYRAIDFKATNLEEEFKEANIET